MSRETRLYGFFATNDIMFLAFSPKFAYIGHVFESDTPLIASIYSSPLAG